MQGSGTYTGTALAQPDEKGRLALPSRLRNCVPGEAKGKQIYITWHPDAPCLIGSGVAFVEGIGEFLKELQEDAAAEGRGFNMMAVRRRLNGGSPVPLDGSGRFIMPDNLAELGELEGELFFLGMGPFFEIWDYDRLMRLEGEEYAVAQAQARAEKRALDRKAARA